ncbi:hypothetical protein J1N09_13070 [Aureitalea sp. L0-47]|uniref:DUF6252 family protein n=1 Tax=Aureitalea sp. L0-47 TaxID=2816962 RepID=UPI002236FF7F|nr:DUF6252 family protein [Aureitalea sp. L0-47]MCW5520773.1 hypothetical protein [Aureitalea sp. L0-47]
MKRFQLVSWLFLCFLALQFSACDNEPLEGVFIIEEEIVAEEGQFVANIGGQSWTASAAGAVFFADNTLVISGTLDGTGQTILLTVENAAVNLFDLTAGVGTINAAVYIDGNPDNPFTSEGANGGFGQMEITDIDTENLTITGTFSFEGVRFALDSEGNPIIDGNGDPVIENISISGGSFNAIPYTEDIGGGGGGGGMSLDPFFAKVDDVDFIPESVTTTRTLIADVPMINIVALNAEGAKIRIDIPEFLGTGTFAMEQLSDGTKLIAQYNAGMGTEDLSSNPGTIEITEFNTLTGRIVANFAFTATDPLGLDPTVVEITEGNFEVLYEPEATNPNNSMFANVDGMDWVANFVDAFEFDFSGTETVTARGYNNDSGELIEITFPKNLEPGSYDFVSTAAAGESIAKFYTEPGGTEFTSTDGAIIVITNELSTGGTINAAFLFLAEDLTGGDPASFNITGGEFTVELP